MLFLILLIVLLSVILFFVVRRISKEAYRDFVLQNSVHLEKLREINSRYMFFPRVSFDQTHTYDNENFYQTVSCLDYLTYQLQFMSSKVINQIHKEEQNEQLYKKYLSETNALTKRGVFLIEPKKLKYEKLVAIENRLIRENTYPCPHVHFSINITLYRSQLNGTIRGKKSETYYANDILNLITKLNDRRGSFFNNQEIWNAICRVERGKVSNKMRFSIYERDGYRCRRCGVSQRYALLEIDHIIPIAKGGKSTYQNLQTLCHRCNTEKGHRLNY